MARSYIFDGAKLNILKNWRLNPLSTVERVDLGASLDTRHIGLPVYDTTARELFFWTGIAWQTSGSGGGGGGTGSGIISVYNETPSGLTNGINLNFNTVSPYISGSTRVTVNGIKQKPGVGNDYRELGTTQITFLNPLPANANILVDYDINA